jgi:hypothetical protein
MTNTLKLQQRKHIAYYTKTKTWSTPTHTTSHQRRPERRRGRAHRQEINFHKNSKVNTIRRIIYAFVVRCPNSKIFRAKIPESHSLLIDESQRWTHFKFQIESSNKISANASALFGEFKVAKLFLGLVHFNSFCLSGRKICFKRVKVSLG